jgi:PhnB protein
MPIVEGQRVIPMLSYEDVGRSADWIAEVFGFTETGRWSDDTGRVTHVNLELGGGLLMLGWPSADYESPRHHAETCEQARRWSETPYVVDGVLVYVDDIEAHFARATAAGAHILSRLEDNPAVGQRQYRAEDIEGHRWMFAQVTRQ